jgi:hypothetical protein
MTAAMIPAMTSTPPPTAPPMIAPIGTAGELYPPLPPPLLMVAVPEQAEFWLLVI